MIRSSVGSERRSAVEVFGQVYFLFTWLPPGTILAPVAVRQLLPGS
jgi:hypothetical protein